MYFKLFRKTIFAITILLILSFCMPLIAVAFPPDNIRKTEGISSLDLCTKDPSVILHGELIVQEDFYSVHLFTSNSILFENSGYFTASLMPALLDKPPIV